MRFILAFLLLTVSAIAQTPAYKDSLLDHFAGTWILQGTIAGQPTTHDVVAEWVLGHQYLRFHEISREKNAAGGAEYEATVFIGMDPDANGYACLWLDNTGPGGLNGKAIGHAARSGNTMAFIFKGGDGSLFHTTFIYNRSADTWQWTMDEEKNGKMEPFARVGLKRS